MRVVNFHNAKWLTKPIGALHQWLLPPTCALCGAAGQAPDFDLCEPCEADLPKQCISIGLAAGGPVDHSWAAFDYDFPVDAMIRELKFAQRLHFARVLGLATTRRLAAASITAANVAARIDCLVPVPLHVRRLRERGFNQAYEIARCMGQALAIPVHARLVMRRHHTAAQSSLSAQARATNMSGAFKVMGCVAHSRLAIIDDVSTTGATVRELAQALKHAGAGRVEVWTVAHALRGDQRA